MLNITLITVGKIKNSDLNSLALGYQKRLKPYGRLTLQELKAESFSSATRDKAKKLEGERIQAALDRQNEAQVYLLAEHGTQFNSLDFAAKIKDQSLILVIAGSLGFAKELENKYPKISLSPLTFPHELARVVLLEQIYRAATIISNKEYHY